MKLNFENDYYKKEAFKHSKQHNYENSNKAKDAFFIVLKDIKKEDMSNLIALVQQNFKKMYNLDLSEDDVYEITQRSGLKNEYKELLLELAYTCIDNGQHLGNNTILDGKINTSSWISHSLFEGRLCRQLAIKEGLNPETAQKIGILHDYGRKYTHSFEHVIIGYEKLIDLGWNEEAIACLTHSFINGNRCANNEPAEEGFYVDGNGNPQWEEEVQKDDITEFLESYKYNEYDNILTIADLMSTDRGIVSPFDRIEDIATRKKPDIKNRAYFIAEFSNKLNEYITKINKTKSVNIKIIKADHKSSLEHIMLQFKKVSDRFFKEYKENVIINKNNEKIAEKLASEHKI